MTRSIPALAVLALVALGATSAEAKGCLKGALVGGVAGHYAGHGLMGAAAGCLGGRALANRRARRDAQAPRPVPAR